MVAHNLALSALFSVGFAFVHNVHDDLIVAQARKTHAPSPHQSPFHYWVEQKKGRIGAVLK